ncbi:MAG TPA: PstS family phosphate ABC transporter substrate-binding protein [Chitinophagaceae bacterium]|nr:PstS family phosphate ABC transporter substrate-binding protein [Chitinophagaceae bacterium]
MKKTTLRSILLIMLSLLVFSACNFSGSSDDSETEAIKVKGSDTVLPISQKAAEGFNKKHPDSLVSVTGGGSGVGITALINGTTDIAQASRKMKFIEKQKIKDNGQKVVETVIAYDALSLVVHPSNKVKQLTRKQLEKIFTGEITNWKEVGGADMEIIPYARQTSSGTYEFFRSHVLDDKSYMSGIMSMASNGAIIQSVSQTKGAIGYVGLAYLNDSVQPVSISTDGGDIYVNPTVENAKNKSYPLVRPLFFYYLAGNSSKVKSFVGFVHSAEGQKNVSDIGFIPVK